MADSVITDRTAFWREHVAAWKATDLTQRAYCQEHDLQRSAFGYWVRKLRREADDPIGGPSAFVSVAYRSSDSGLILALPNGLEIRGIESQNLGVVRQLLGLLA